MNHTYNIGFISTRFAGTDGVSLETQKWETILNQLGHECYFFAGECDHPPERSFVVPEAHFSHPEIITMSNDLFDDYIRSSETSEKIQNMRCLLKRKLYDFTAKFNIQLLIVENALAIPMNVPLGMALTEYISETSIPTIAHHHDFTWERIRFSVNAAQDYLQACFPPQLPSISHTVINSFAQRQLALRTGLSATLIPNVMDFDNPPTPTAGVEKELRAALGIDPDCTVLLQPTRIVPRKRIELAIELARRLNREKCVLVISHLSGDEGNTYQKYLEEYARLLNVDVIFGSDIINHVTQSNNGGKRIFSLADAYQIADLVTYPSTIEGFGNAFLETIYYRRPIVISNYEIFKTDIRPKGFDVIGFDNFISDDTVNLSRQILQDPVRAKIMVDQNYDKGRRHYSYSILKNQLIALLNSRMGI